MIEDIMESQADRRPYELLAVRRKKKAANDDTAVDNFDSDESNGRFGPSFTISLSEEAKKLVG